MGSTPEKAPTVVPNARNRVVARTHEIRWYPTGEIGWVRSDEILQRGTIVGFNLPFDTSRIAVAHGSARGEMRGGFSFDLTQKPDDPRVRVKHLGAREALIGFGVPGQQEKPRGYRNLGRDLPAFRGHFVDINTLGSVLLAGGFSLQSLAVDLRTPTQKRESDEHGRITREYLDYARTDAQVTWECYRELKKRYEGHGLSRNPDRILSEASIGKAYLPTDGDQAVSQMSSIVPAQTVR